MKILRTLQLKFSAFLDGYVFNEHWEDGAFMDDVRQATLRGTHPAANVLFWGMAACLVFAVLWASVASLDQVTRGEGSIIPSGKVQIVQNLDGGIVKSIHTHAGAIVNEGDILLEIDNSSAASSLEERKQRYFTLLGTTARLQALLEGDEPAFSEELNQTPQILAGQQTLYRTKKEEIRRANDILSQQVEQKKRELQEAKGLRSQTQNSWEISKQEYDLTAPLLAQGVVSQVELLRLEREVNELRSERDAARVNVPKAESELQESRSRLAETELRNANEMREELGEARDELNRLNEVLKADVDRVDRTTVRAPVRAEVKQVLVNTVGGVIQPGMDLVELVPLDDSILVEARVKPQDVAFLRAGQEATVRLSAYDFAIYGGLKGNLERISPDTFTDEQTGETFFNIQIRTDRNSFTRNGENLPLITGMQATVDILTGKRTVLQYLLKPINRAREKAFTER